MIQIVIRILEPSDMAHQEAGLARAAAIGPVICEPRKLRRALVHRIAKSRDQGWHQEGLSRNACKLILQNKPASEVRSVGLAVGLRGAIPKYEHVLESARWVKRCMLAKGLHDIEELRQ